MIVASIALLRAVAAPKPPNTRRPLASDSPEPAAAGFAALFVRQYLSWRPSDAEARRRALEAFGSTSLAPEAGAEPPIGGTQSVLWEQVVGEREVSSRLRVYTIQAQTDPGGLRDLSVPVLRRADGRLSLASYPAFVGASATAAADPVQLEGAEVDDAALRAVVTRALRNYLAPAPTQLAADLAPGAHVSTPRSGLVLQELQRLSWGVGEGEPPIGSDLSDGDLSNLSHRGRASRHADRDRDVEAVVAVFGEGGARFTLAYELTVLHVAGRWEVVAIETDPDYTN